MMRALFSAIAGLQNHITFMDVVGNNIANVNTQGFKASRVTFQDMLSQTITGASAPTENRGGVNPAQVGLGMKLGGITVLHGQGSFQSTGRATDFAIEGPGFFILKDGQRTFYTRDGAFDIAVTGELINPTNGFKVQGWQATAGGVIDTSITPASVTIPFGQSIAAQETTTVTLNGNLDASKAPGTVFSTTVDVYDSLGDAHPIEVRFTKNALSNTWDVTVASTDPDVNIGGGQTEANAGDTPVTFSITGGILNPAPGSPLRININLAAATGANLTYTMNLNVDNLTQFASPGQVAATFNNGFSAGEMISFSVGPGGDITGIFSNGTTRAVAQIALASFTNPAGLQRAGSNNFELTSNSGVPNIGIAGTGGRGAIGGGVLEGSNTELAREFTNVVIAQRGFQASSRIISTADSMLEGLVNLLR